jgi:hypothetical protein
MPKSRKEQAGSPYVRRSPLRIMTADWVDGHADAEISRSYGFS